MYAGGNLASLVKLFEHLEWRQIASFLDVVFPKSGLIDGRKVADFVREHVQSTQIEGLPLPFAAVSTDLVTGQEMVIRQGDIIEAIRASISIPGIFTPLRRGDAILVDGGLVNPVPVSVVREMGANYVIAVSLSGGAQEHQGLKVARRQQTGNPGDDVLRANMDGEGATSENETVVSPAPASTSRRKRLTKAFRHKLAAFDAPALSHLRHWLHRDPLPNIFEVLITSLHSMQARIAATNLKTDPPDLLIRPEVGNIHLLDFRSSREAMDIGYRAARAKLADLPESLRSD